MIITKHIIANNIESVVYQCPSGYETAFVNTIIKDIDATAKKITIICKDSFASVKFDMDIQLLANTTQTLTTKIFLESGDSLFVQTSVGEARISFSGSEDVTSSSFVPNNWTFMGDYNPLTEYHINNVIKYKKRLFISKQNEHIGNNPISETLYWDRIQEPTWTFSGDYNSGSEFDKNDIVKYSDRFWISIIDFNSNNEPGTNGSWIEMPDINGVDVGTVNTFSRNSAPVGWLKCNGAAISRTFYSNLFDTIGETFGVGDGSTTFNLPDLRGEFVRGWDDGRGVDTGRGFGTYQAPTRHVSLFNNNDNLYYGRSASTNTEDYIWTAGTMPYTARHGYAASVTKQYYTARPRNQSLLYCIKY